MRIILSIIFVCSCLISKAQDRFLDSVINRHSIQIPSYKISTKSTDTLWLRMPYAKADFLDTSRLSELKGAQILSVDLLFTDYPAYDNLILLNKNRLAALKKILPSSSLHPNIQWQVIRQMNGKDKASAQNMIHGFLINYRKPVTKESTEKELIRVHTYIDKKKEELAAKKPRGPVKHWAIIHANNPSTNKILLGRYIKKIADHPDSLLKERRVGDSIVPVTVKTSIERRFILPNHKGDKKDYDSLYVLIEKKPDGLPKSSEPDNAIEDSTVIKTLLKMPVKNALVVADVTASMSPWLIQLMQFLSAAEQKNNFVSFTCFNDGDDRPDFDKPLARTGGVYTEKYETALHAADLISITMQKGKGGDLPENVCEAIIKAEAKTEKYDNTILIADSWAPVRDIQLLSQIKKPVHIVLCGNRLGAHPDYIMIALATGGTVTAPNLPALNMDALRTLKPLTYNSKVYQLVDGRVKEIQ
jgi:hypothetical protein